VLVLLAVLAAGASAAPPDVDGRLARLPADDPAVARQAFARLIEGGPDAIAAAVARLTGQGDDAAARYALHGLAMYAARPGGEADRRIVAAALAAPLASDLDLRLKEFLVRQLQVCGGAAELAALGRLLSDDDLYDDAIQAIVAIGQGEPARAAEVLTAALAQAPGPRREAIGQALEAVRSARARPVHAPPAPSSPFSQGQGEPPPDFAALLKRLGSPDKGEREAAKAALVRAADPGGAIARALASAQGDVRSALIEVVVARQAGDEVHLAVLRRLADHEDDRVRAEAIAALGELADASLLDWLLVRMASGRGPRERAAAETAFVSICRAASDGPRAMGSVRPMLLGQLTGGESDVARRAAERALAEVLRHRANREALEPGLLAALKQADPPLRAVLLRLLGRIGGPRALAAVRGALQDEDAAVRETATRLLSEWPDAMPAADLLALAQKAQDERERVLWLRAYLRAIDLSGDGPDARLAMCREAMQLARRPEDKRLVLGSAARVPSLGALGWLLGMLEDADLRPHAAGSVLNLAERLADDHPAEAVEAAKRGLEAAGDNPGYRTRAEHLVRRVGKD
jgi:hypothetical protein